MIVRRFLPLIVVVLLLPVYFFSLSTTATQRKMIPQEGEASYVLPSPLLKIASLEFKGLSSDFLFLKALTFFGSTLERTERPRIKEHEWLWLYDVLNASTDLDPYFYDPYYFANANLTWGGHMVKESNRLLAKGSRYRDWDWTIPFYMGFNEFYFLHDNAKAFEYLMEGAKRPDAPPIMETLAVRMAYKVNRTGIAIAFLQETLTKTKDKVVRKELENRLKVLEGVSSLEQAVEVYRSTYGTLPSDLRELQSLGIIARMPEDPFGGEFYLDEDGAVKTSSDLFYTQGMNRR